MVFVIHVDAVTTIVNTIVDNKLDTFQQSTIAVNQKIVNSQIAEMTKYYNTLQKEEKAELQAIAVDWGLPVKLAAGAEFNQLVKLISVAIHLTK